MRAYGPMVSAIGPVSFEYRRLRERFAGAEPVGISRTLGALPADQVDWQNRALGEGMPRMWSAADLRRKSWKRVAKIDLQNCERSLSQRLSGVSRRRRDDDVLVEQKCFRRDRGNAQCGRPLSQRWASKAASGVHRDARFSKPPSGDLAYYWQWAAPGFRGTGRLDGLGRRHQGEPCA